MRILVLLLVLVATVRIAAQESAGPAHEKVAIGAAVDEVVTDRRWQSRRLSELGASSATVLFFTTSDCPIVRRYLPRIGRLASDYSERGVVVMTVDVEFGGSLVDAAGEVVLAAPACAFGKDMDGALARACGVVRTATAVVLDADRRLVYRGRVDDQYGYAGARTEPSRADLQCALDDLLAGRPVQTAETEVSGCKITWPRGARPAGGAGSEAGAVPTYAGAIAGILQKHCQECHRPGGEAPFSLLGPRSAEKRAAMIAEVVREGRMPPWYGSSRYGEFVNHRGLTPDERDAVVAWADGGAPRGDQRGMPPAVERPDQKWRIGEPDQVLSIKAPVRLPADGSVPYKYLLLPFRFTQDTWVEAIEIRPDNRRVLHHCNLARITSGQRWSQDGFITGYVPGGDPMVLDPGTAVRIPAGSALVVQAHYVTTGQPEVDRLRVGLRFPRVEVEKELKVTVVTNTRFRIPPGAAAEPVRARRRLNHDVDGIGLFVHMHLRGRDISVFSEQSDETRETLLVVPNYNFDWQQSYRWSRAGKRFEKGTVIAALAHFDNSAWNPFNPAPDEQVRFGPSTTDEMMYAFLFWTKAGESLGLAVNAETGRVRSDEGK